MSDDQNRGGQQDQDRQQGVPGQQNQQNRDQQGDQRPQVEDSDDFGGKTDEDGASKGGNA